MAYNIQPVQIWTNGQTKTATTITATSINDNLENSATFYWQLSNETETLVTGNTSISGEDYANWNSETDINLAAYQYICGQLNLTLEP